MSRRIKVATGTLARYTRKPVNREDNISFLTGMLGEMSRVKPDVILLPEMFSSALAAEGDYKDSGKEDTKFLCAMAKKFHTHIIGSLYDRRNDGYFNTSVVAGPDGTVVGKYDKIHLTSGEIEAGMVLGSTDQMPIKTSFGTIACQLCFDANWPMTWKQMADNGAEIIFFSSAFPGGRLLNSYALLNKVYVVSSIWSLTSGIIDNTGKWIAQANREWPYGLSWVWAQIDLERTVFHLDFHLDKMTQVRDKYGDRIKIEAFDLEGFFTLEPVDQKISIPGIIKEFGLVPYREYIDKSYKMQEKFRNAAKRRPAGKK